jgi:branched-chain amino acid transport system substrate-binding protein
MISLRTPRTAVAVILGLSVSVLVACGGSTTSSNASGGGNQGKSEKSSSPYLWYITTDTTGPTAVLGKAEVAGAKVAVKDVNAKGGIRGRKVELKVVNDTDDPTKAVSLLQKQLSSGNPPDFVYPGASSSVSLSLLPILTRNKILSMGGTVSTELNDPKKFPYFFGGSPPGKDYVPTFVKTAKNKGYHKVGMIYSNDATGKSSLKLYKDALDKAGIQFVSASYPSDSLDMTSQLQKLQGEKPDALIVDGYGAPALYVLRGRAQIGWDVPAYGDQLASATPIAGKLKAAQVKNYRVILEKSVLKDQPQHPDLPKVIKEIKQDPDGKYLPAVGIALYGTTYDLLQYVDYVAEHQKTTDTVKLAKAFEHFKTPAKVPWVTRGPDSQYAEFTYTPTDHFVTTKASSFKYVRPGSYDNDGFFVPGKGF